MFTHPIRTENQQIFLPELEERNIQLFIKREDQIHQDVSGNKFRKLKYNIQEAKKQAQTTLLTFGGAFSNHILAAAIAGKVSGFKTIGIIRGEELGESLEKTFLSNATLKKAYENGMQLEFISRDKYRQKTTPEFLNELQSTYGRFYLIPEGGTNELAIQGCEEILTNEDAQFDYICCCVGTGGTISGLIRSTGKHQKVIGFPALKGNFLNDEVKRFVADRDNWNLVDQYHFGGYGKFSESLISFINTFKQQTKIPLDPIYTGKMMFGILEMIRKEEIPNNSKILMIHTGGLQGIKGFNQQLEKKGKDLKIDL
ncbi:pyridoxal-phosphate dependent enzyme [Pseudotenacibaculum sp. MALMAid0570]|uniref:1-aminocyclopropane-1-carboxylate deaminase/D-cysteine desulfhydrase n=1 Tax=Pseudotenacibaculum sp. MALMAid0570 TaxID=3143938 RepID=UPI0032DFDE49